MGTVTATLLVGLQHVALARRRIVDDRDGGVELERRGPPIDDSENSERVRPSLSRHRRMVFCRTMRLPSGKRGDGLAGAERRIRRAGDEPHIVRRGAASAAAPDVARAGSPGSAASSACARRLSSARRQRAQQRRAPLLNLRRDAIVSSLLLCRIRRHDLLDAEGAVVRNDDVDPVARAGVLRIRIDRDQGSLRASIPPES